MQSKVGKHIYQMGRKAFILLVCIGTMSSVQAKLDWLQFICELCCCYCCLEIEGNRVTQAGKEGGDVPGGAQPVYDNPGPSVPPVAQMIPQESGEPSSELGSSSRRQSTIFCLDCARRIPQLNTLESGEDSASSSGGHAGGAL